MLIRHHDAEAPSSSEITPETAYLNRRQLLGAGLALSATSGLLLPRIGQAATMSYSPAAERNDVPAYLKQKIVTRRFAVDNPTREALTPFRDATTYNNFYEFGTGKDDPSERAGTLRINPWSVRIDGLCDKPGVYNLEDILKPHTLEDRIYRFRCVEAWSMVVPWLGIPLGDILKRFSPRSNAKYVHFATLVDAKQLPGQRTPTLNWPYRESLRLDEAMHPLTLMTVGLYGRSLPDQNGAPLRLIVPWKYGFKSIKSIVQITFSDKPITTTWMGMAPDEYGYYANVNPAVDHPRWSQARERRLPTSLFSPNWRPTLPFNGYGQVASLYKGLDLKRNF